jgi:hypothetical protein
MDVAAEFAALVAKAGSEKSSPPPPALIVPQTAPTAYVVSPQVMATNGPDSSYTNSIPAPESMSPGSIHTPGEVLPVSKQQILDIEESSNITRVAPSTISAVAGTPPAWKQGQLPHLTSVSLNSKCSDSNSKSDVSNQAVVDKGVRQAELEVEQQVVDFVPSVSAAELIISTLLASVVKDFESGTFVSVWEKALNVEVVRIIREKFPALKRNDLIHQSPRQKQPQRPEGAAVVSQATTVASIPPVQSTLPPVVAASRDTSAVETKVSNKPASTEESAPTSSAFPVPQPPKEKRDQDKPHGIPPDLKQGQLPHLTSVSLSSNIGGGNSKSDVSNETLINQEFRQAKMEVEQQVVDFLPIVSGSAQQIISNVFASIVKDLESKPFVSARGKALNVEIIRIIREKFPALKHNAPIHQSSRQKQPQHPESSSIVPQATTISSLPPVQSTLPPVVAASRDTPAVENKVSKKPASTEEPTPTSSAFSVSQPPKEKRDQDRQHGRDRERSSVMSQGRGESEKLASSASSSQHHGRDREKSSRDKDKASAAPQCVPRDRDKSASQGRDRDKSSTKEAITSPAAVIPVAPAVAPTIPQPQPEQLPSVRATAPAEETQQQQTNGEVAAAKGTEGESVFVVKFACGQGL